MMLEAEARATRQPPILGSAWPKYIGSFPNQNRMRDHLARSIASRAIAKLG
jgi:hypothetical protein